MNINKFVVLGFLIISIASCASIQSTKSKSVSTDKSEMIAKSDEVIIEGTITDSGMTFYQYGTHILKNKDLVFAIRSTNIVLSNYKGQYLKLRAKKVSGYPMSGGPDYYEILEIK